MKTCTRCNVELKVGLAINPTLPDYLKHAVIDPPGPNLITSERLRVDNVWKCPKCGHSEDM